MNHWLESAEVLSRLAGLAAAGRPAALATVVRIVGSSYRRPGAKLLVVAAGEGMGSVSGGCLEGDVREVARGVLAGGAPRLLHYDTGGEEEVFGLGLGCRGQIDVFVQPATHGPLGEVVGQWRAALAGDAPFAVATVVGGSGAIGTTVLVEPADAAEDALVDSPRAASAATAPVSGPDATAITHDVATSTPDADLLARRVADPSRAATAADAPASTPVAPAITPNPELLARIREAARKRLVGGRSACEEIAGHLVFVEVLQPPPHVVVCGAGDDAIPLVERAADVGFRVTVVDHREGLLQPARFPRAAALLPARPETKAVALPPPPSSLAVVMTHSFVHDREWVRRLLATGIPYVGLLGPRARAAQIRRAIGAERDGRLFGPVGLDVGADGPRQVAISIVAELLAVVAGRTPRHLAERAEAIHVG